MSNPQPPVQNPQGVLLLCRDSTDAANPKGAVVLDISKFATIAVGMSAIAAQAALIAADIDEIKTDVDTISTNIALITPDIDTIATQVTNIHTDTAGIKTTLDSIKTDADSLPTIATNTGNIHTDTAGIKTTLDSIKTDADSIPTIATNTGNIRTDTSSIATSSATMATQQTTIATQTTTIATNTGTAGTQLTNINAKLPTLDAKSRFKTSDIPTMVYGGIKQLGATGGTDTTIYASAASVRMKMYISNMDTVTRSFQIGTAATFADATGIIKGFNLAAGQVREYWLDEVPSGTTIYAACSSANKVNITFWTGVI